MTSITPASPDERDLIRSLHEGSVSAFAEIYERTAPVLYSLALRIVGSRERAACVLEDLYEEIWRDRASWRASTAGPMGPLGAGVRRPFSAAGGPGAISGGSGPTVSGSASSAGGPPGSGSIPGEIPLIAWIARCRELALAQVGPDPAHSTAQSAAFAETGARGAAWPALAALSDRDRFALEEAYFRGTPPREIAAKIGAPTTDAGMMLRNALARFRDYADQGAEEGESAEARPGIAPATAHAERIAS